MKPTRIRASGAHFEIARGAAWTDRLRSVMRIALVALDTPVRLSELVAFLSIRSDVHFLEQALQWSRAHTCSATEAHSRLGFVHRRS